MGIKAKNVRFEASIDQYFYNCFINFILNV